MSKRCMVLGIDGSSGARAATAWCAEMAGPLDAEVIAVQVLPSLITLFPPPTPSAELYNPEETKQALRAKLEGCCEPLRNAGVEYQTMLAEGAPSETLMRVADDKDAAMIVVGRRGTGGFTELLLGSVPHQLSHHALRPVVVVPAR